MWQDPQNPWHAKTVPNEDDLKSVYDSFAKLQWRWLEKCTVIAVADERVNLKLKDKKLFWILKGAMG